MRVGFVEMILKGATATATATIHSGLRSRNPTALENTLKIRLHKTPKIIELRPEAV